MKQFGPRVYTRNVFIETKERSNYVVWADTHQRTIRTIGILPGLWFEILNGVYTTMTDAIDNDRC